MAMVLESTTQTTIVLRKSLGQFIKEIMLDQWSPYVQVLVVSRAAFELVRNISTDPPNTYVDPKFYV